jgi:hypothetical protein
MTFWLVAVGEHLVEAAMLSGSDLYCGFCCIFFHGSQVPVVGEAQSVVGVVGVMADEHCTDVAGVGLDEN